MTEAARLMRERGIAGASVDEVMGAAGFTRGGFYAHFDDKIDLAAAAIEHAFDNAIENLFGPSMPLEGKAWRQRASKRYLSESHVEDPGHGCAAPSLGAEIARAEPRLQSTTHKQLLRVLARIEERIGGPVATRRQRAMAFLATCVGGITLARAAGDKDFASTVLEACRTGLVGDDD